MNGLELVVVRSIAVYLFIILFIRFFGKKELTQLSVADLVFIILIGNSVQNAMVGNDAGLVDGLVAAFSLFVINMIIKKIFFNSDSIRHFVQGEPVLLVYKGKVNEANLKSAEIPFEELEQVVREHGIEEIAEVDLAVLEIDGNISVLSDEFRKKTVQRRRAHKIVRKSS
ncbi:MAG TPA: YetF domain-containing protein [Candidatus Saccharimonadales bacterium]|nr:YetF domain-containing protein [Candidatus Saccharimonadales bacterium]